MQYQAEKTECSDDEAENDDQEPNTCQNRETEVSLAQSQEGLEVDSARGKPVNSMPHEFDNSRNSMEELQELFMHSGDGAEDFQIAQGHWSICDDDLNFYRTLLTKKGSVHI